uniref:Uncharacterized protein n=1 Tax=Canis lupus dingo TaxID=286419 RepID=A0A8C0JXR3_CANLU
FHLIFSCISGAGVLFGCLVRSLVHFLIGLFVFLLSFRSSSYILDNSPLSDVSFANVFSPSVACLLIFFILSFTKQNFSLCPSTI